MSAYHEKGYIPVPIDTSDVQLPDELLELTEQLAENVHDIWAVNRIAEGWTYGTVRDGGQMETPCLVPYQELPESEKEYDRNTALETLKLILKLGYEIRRK
ncbi:MAG: Ryanodine receptor Ryr [Lachnospiraceae bacterium]|nr:Ryanodine receptor Ryr [Lachnospiraceae bacterium]